MVHGWDSGLCELCNTVHCKLREASTVNIAILQHTIPYLYTYAIYTQYSIGYYVSAPGSRVQLQAAAANHEPREVDYCKP